MASPCASRAELEPKARLLLSLRARVQDNCSDLLVCTNKPLPIYFSSPNAPNYGLGGVELLLRAPIGGADFASLSWLWPHLAPRSSRAAARSTRRRARPWWSRASPLVTKRASAWSRCLSRQLGASAAARRKVLQLRLGREDVQVGRVDHGGRGSQLQRCLVAKPRSWREMNAADEADGGARLLSDNLDVSRPPARDRRSRSFTGLGRGAWPLLASSSTRLNLVQSDTSRSRSPCSPPHTPHAPQRRPTTRQGRPMKRLSRAAGSRARWQPGARMLRPVPKWGLIGPTTSAPLSHCNTP